MIEVDGGTHDVDDLADQTRTDYLEQQGYTVLRFSNLEVMSNIEGVLRRLADAIVALRRAPLPSLSPEGERA